MIIFDFDGVLIDSVEEVVVSAYNTITGSLCTSLEELDPGFLRNFLKFRHHYKSSGEIHSLATWCLNEKDNPDAVLTKDHFHAILDSQEDKLLEQGELFFATRNKFAEKDLDKWLKLNKPYEPLWSELKKIDPKEVLILTNKNRFAVEHITKHFGINVPIEQIYSADGGATKQENFEKIKVNHPSNFYYFIDDALRNLEKLCKVEPDPEKLSLILSTWGYIEEDDIEKARDLGFLIYNQDDAVTLIEAVYT